MRTHGARCDGRGEVGRHTQLCSNQALARCYSALLAQRIERGFVREAARAGKECDAGAGCAQGATIMFESVASLRQ